MKPRRGGLAAVVFVAAIGAGASVAVVRGPETARDSGAPRVSEPMETSQIAPTSSVSAGVAVPTLVSGSDSTPASTPDGDSSAADLTGTEPCVLQAGSVRLGASGPDVACIQSALAIAGVYEGPASAVFDQVTDAAVRRIQGERGLFVDGVVGRESGISLGIWPDEASSVVRTPVPPEGAADLMGYPLSSVATSGPDAPPLPPNSGTGRRVVYERAGQRVWAVDDSNTVIRSYLVTGSKYSNELPGTHVVYSRSDVSTAWNGKAWLPKMIRWLKTDIGAIGFHAIPLHVEDDSPYQTDAELGTRMSGGCQRQANLDADFLWDFAQVGTPVVVI